MADSTAICNFNVTGSLTRTDRRAMEVKIDAWNAANPGLPQKGYSTGAERKQSFEEVSAPIAAAFFSSVVAEYEANNVDKPLARDIIQLLRETDLSTAELNAILAAFP